MTIYTSSALRSAHSIEQVVDLVNEGTCEGMEGIEFTADMLAGQYAYEAQLESDYPISPEAIEAHLEFLQDEGANFSMHEAIAHGLRLANDE